MSEWKMNRMLSSIWGKLEEKRDQRKLIKFKSWCALVDKKCASTLYALKALECADTDKKEKLTMVTNKVIVGVNELITLLSTNAFKNDTSVMNANSSLQDSIRMTLLEVWNPLLTSMPKLEFIDVTVVTQIHKTLLLLMCRDEFSCDSLTASYSKEGSNRDIVVKYRSMLQTTLQTATQRLLEKTHPPAGSLTYSGPVNSMMNISFLSKVLAIVYWRLPYVGSAISQILEIPNMELLAPVLSFPAFPDDACTTPGYSSSETSRVTGVSTNSAPTTSIPTINPTSTNISTSDASAANETNSNPLPSNGTKVYNNHFTPPKVRGSALFGWAALYKDLPPLRDANGGALVPSASTPLVPVASTSSTSTPTQTSPIPLPPSPSTWLGVLAKFDTTYVTFFKEWILHVKSILGRVEWSTVPGFPRLLQSLLYQMRTKEQPPPPLSKPYPLLELQYLLLEQTNAELIDAFVKAAFLRTNVFDLLSVLNTLQLLEGWFSELQSHEFILPSTFDISFYCTGIDILLKSDHHQVVLRVLSLLYTFSELFENGHRVCLFDLLLSKYFYVLFMHWDPGVRNAYHQLLIFKMVRIKRSTLYNDGYIVKELSQVGLTSYHAKEAQQGENAGSVSSFLNNRSGSGFFSTFSNVLPAFFSLSSSPDKTTSSSPDKDSALTKGSPPTTDTAGVQLDTKDSTSSSGNQQEQISPDKVTPYKPQSAPTNTIKMGSERTSSKSNAVQGSQTQSSLEEGFVEVPNTSSTNTNTTTNSNPNSNFHISISTNHAPPGGSSGPGSDDAGRNETINGTPDGSSVTSHAVLVKDPSNEIDVQLFLKLNSYLKTIADQLRKPTAKKLFEERLEPYAPNALAEFNQHLARYHQWELKNEEPPRFMSLPFARMGEG